MDVASAQKLAEDFNIAMKKIESLKRENRDLRRQVENLKRKNEELWLSNKIQMSKIVEYRRKIEHYEDGAPLYVPKDV